MARNKKPRIIVPGRELVTLDNGCQRYIRPIDPYVDIEEVANALRAVLGKDAVHQGSNSDLGEPRGFTPSGVPELDRVLDREGRGWPWGRVVEVYGASQTVKTGFGYALIGQTHKAGGAAALYPCEGEYNEWLALRYGVDLERLVLGDDPTVEGVFTSFNRAMTTIGRRGCFVGMVDSVAGMSTRDELAALESGEEIKRDRAAQVRALMISAALRKIGAAIPRTNAILFLVNQVRDDPDSQYGGAKPPGGKAIGFYASIRLEIKYLGKYKRVIKGVSKVAGFNLRVIAIKNRLADPFTEADIRLDFEKGLLPMPDKRKRKGSDDDE